MDDPRGPYILARHPVPGDGSDSINPNTPPPGMQARKRVSQACKPCGSKKIKCDGLVPTCSPCRQRGQDCHYGISKRSAVHRNGAPSPHLRHSLPPATQMNRDEKLTPPKEKSAAQKPKESSNLPSELSTRLFQKYFSYIHPIWPILYKPMYASLDYRNPSEIMPIALVAAIYSIAACIDNKPQPFATNTIVTRYPEPQVFFEEAMESLLEGDSKSKSSQLSHAFQPSILNCQVLTILALQQHGVAEYSRAAVLCGIAASMAIELRLHRPTLGDPVDGEVRYRLWWNVYILEKMLSCEMGRPVLLRAEETDCPYPSASEADEFELMSVYVRDRGQTDQVRNTSIKLRTISALHTTIQLSVLIERVSREIYGLAERRAIRANQAKGEAKRIELWLAMRDWERDLDASALRLDLTDDLTSVPATVTNCVVYWSGTILVHRPFIARWIPQPDNPDSVNPLDVSLQAAQNICIILEKYFDRLPGLPCDMVFCIFTAASTLLYHSKQAQSNDSLETRRRLKLCIHWLGVLGKSWKTAGARVQLLAEGETARVVDEKLRRLIFAAFDLNAELDAKTNGQSHTPSHGPDAHAGAPVVDDWRFLSAFGDEEDEFWSLDVQLRELLAGDFAGRNSRFL